MLITWLNTLDWGHTCQANIGVTRTTAMALWLVMFLHLQQSAVLRCADTLEQCSLLSRIHSDWLPYVIITLLAGNAVPTQQQTASRPSL